MERNTLHWPCVPDVQSDVTNAIGFMYIYSYVDIGGREARSNFHVMFSLFVCTCIHSLMFCSYTSVMNEKYILHVYMDSSSRRLNS